ncbi:tryptophan--tRNA ligase, partial [bacterium]|nr:tryptophan--tRNA ligase [bacterium]
EGCTGAGIGCVQCKRKLAENMEKVLGSIRRKAEELRSDPNYIHDVLNDGAKHAGAIAAEVVDEARAAMGLKRQQ